MVTRTGFYRCAICVLTAKKQRQIARDWAGGVPHADLAKKYGLPKNAAVRHFTRCAAAHIALTEHALTVNYNHLLNHMNIQIEALHKQAEIYASTGGPWGVTYAGEQIDVHMDRIKALLDRIQDHTVAQLTTVVSDITAHYVLNCPATAALHLTELMQQYPAARGALKEYEVQNGRDNHKAPGVPDW